MGLIFSPENSRMTQEAAKTTLGERFKEIRSEFGYTQEEFADFLGIDQSMVSKIESGASGISLEIATPIITQFHISFEWLILGAGPKFVTGEDGPVKTGLHWRKAVEIVDGFIIEAGLRKKLKEGRVGYLTSQVAAGLAEGQDPAYIRPLLAKAVLWIQAKAQSKGSE